MSSDNPRKSSAKRENVSFKICKTRTKFPTHLLASSGKNAILRDVTRARDFVLMCNPGCLTTSKHASVPAPS